MPIRIALVDDHTLVREGFRGILQLEQDMELDFECDTFAKAKTFLDGSPSIDVFIVDILLGDDTGFPLIKLARLNKIKCIVVSMHGKEPYISEAINSGANGYISKDSASTDLIAGIRAVHEDKLYYSDDIREYLANAAEQNPFMLLTHREIEVCQFIVDGFKVKKIAKELNISPKTVYVHKANAYKNLGISSTQELFQLAKEHQLYLDGRILK